VPPQATAYGAPPSYGTPGYGAPSGYAPPTAYGAPPGYGQPPGYPPPATSPSGYPLADFGERLGAYLIDAFILGAVALVFYIPAFCILGAVLPNTAATNQVDPDGEVTPDPGAVLGLFFGLFAIILLVTLVARYVYQVEMMFRSGQTVGKRIMKIMVVPLTPGVQLTRGMAVKRYLVESIVGIIVPLFSYVDGFWQLWDKPYKQCLHDKWAETVVIKINR
jgi:uncharacterized RDD family membrane protein YckC